MGKKNNHKKPKAKQRQHQVFFVGGDFVMIDEVAHETEEEMGNRALEKLAEKSPLLDPRPFDWAIGSVRVLSNEGDEGGFVVQLICKEYFDQLRAVSPVHLPKGYVLQLFISRSLQLRSRAGHRVWAECKYWVMDKCCSRCLCASNHNMLPQHRKTIPKHLCSLPALLHLLMVPSGAQVVWLWKHRSPLCMRIATHCNRRSPPSKRASAH